MRAAERSIEIGAKLRKRVQLFLQGPEERWHEWEVGRNLACVLFHAEESQLAGSTCQKSNTLTLPRSLR